MAFNDKTNDAVSLNSETTSWQTDVSQQAYSAPAPDFPERGSSAAVKDLPKLVIDGYQFNQGDESAQKDAENAGLQFSPMAANSDDVESKKSEIEAKKAEIEAKKAEIEAKKTVAEATKTGVEPAKTKVEGDGAGTDATKKEDTKEAQDLAEAARNKYQADVEKMIDASNKSWTVEKGEGYYHVLKRMYPNMLPEELSKLASECKKLNGGDSTLTVGQTFPIMCKEQKMRLTDQIMNDYDAKHGTESLDKYGDFAKEKGDSANAHNSLRKEMSKKIEDKLKSNEVATGSGGGGGGGGGGGKKPGGEGENPSDTKPGDKGDKPSGEKPGGSAPAIEKLSMQELTETAKKIFPTIDLDKDGVLSNRELDRASRNKDLSDKEQQAVAGLLAGEKQISSLSQDVNDKAEEFCPLGISMKDLDSLANAQENANIAKAAESIYSNEELYKSIDKNGNGLSREEINQALQDRDDLSAEQRKALRYIKDNFDKLKNNVNEGNPSWDDNTVSQKDIAVNMVEMSQSDSGQLINLVTYAASEAYANQVKEAKTSQTTSTERDGDGRGERNGRDKRKPEAA